jgi:hypothetical protein
VPAPPSKDAFLCYRRIGGARVAHWLYWRLARYELPAEIRDQLSPDDPPRPRRLRIFLDVLFERASPDFWSRKIVPALEASRHLIAVSTPQAFQELPGGRPNWMCREISTFLDLMEGDEGPRARSVVLVLAPGAPEDRFPGRLNEPGAERPGEPPRWDFVDLRLFHWRHLRPRAREQAEDAFLKIAAHLFDVPEKHLPTLSGYQARRRARRSRWLTTAACTLALVLGGLTYWALRERGTAIEQRNVAIARALATEAFRVRSQDPSKSLLLFLASLEVRDTARARSGLFSSLQQDAHLAMQIISAPAPVTALGWNDAGWYALGFADGRAAVWKPREPAAGEMASVVGSLGEAMPANEAGKAIVQARFLPGDELVRGVDAEGRVLDWSLAAPSSAPTLRSRVTEEEISAADFAHPDVLVSWDGSTVFVDTWSGLFAWSDGEAPRRVEAPVEVGGPLAISRDDRWLACYYRAGESPAEANSVGVLDLESGEWVATIPDERAGGWLTSLAFSPDRDRLFVGRSQASLEILDTTDWRPVRTLALAPRSEALNAGNTVGPLHVDRTGEHVASYYRQRWLLWDVEAGVTLGDPIPARNGLGFFGPTSDSIVVLPERDRLRRWDFDLGTLRKWALVNARGDLSVDEWNAIAAPLPYPDLRRRGREASGGPPRMEVDGER